MVIVVQILLGLSVIGFGVLLWKCAERWTWVPMVIAPIVFIEAIVFLSLVAMSTKSRSAWQKVNVELEQRLAEATLENEQLKYGIVGSADAQRAVLPLELALMKLRKGTGRVWRGMKPIGPMTLSMPADADLGAGGGAAAGGGADPAAAAGGGADPAAAGGGAAAPANPNNEIVPGTLLYAFSETLNADGRPVPHVFLGQYRVVNSNAQQVQLGPIRPINTLSQLQQQAINGAPSWALYELMPIDMHEPFFVEGSRKRDEAIFGDVDEQFLNQTIAGKVPPEVLQSYLKDGRQAQSDDPPETRWLKVELLKDRSFDVDTTSQLTPMDGKYFDSRGLAEDTSLQMDDSNAVTFKAGTELLMKAEAADELIAKGEAKLIDAIYIRPLNDYDEIERKILQRLDTLAEQEVMLKRELASMTDVNEKNNRMIRLGQTEQVQLEAEQKQYRIEKAAILAYSEELKKRMQTMRTQLSQLYQQNLQYAQQVQRAQTMLKQQIDQRTATASAP